MKKSRDYGKCGICVFVFSFHIFIRKKKGNMHKLVFLILGFLLMMLTRITLAAFVPNTSWQGNLSSNWSLAGNWDNGVPTDSSQVAIDDVGGYSVVIGSGISAVASAIQMGWASGSVSHMTIETGGSLMLNNFLTIAQEAGTNATVTMTGGVIDVEGNISVGYGGTGVLNMTGGNIYIGPPAGGKSLRIGVQAGSNGYVNLHGGIITTTGLTMRENGGIGMMDITTGTLIINGQWSASHSYFQNGWVTAYGGAGTLNFNYNAGTNKTTITAQIQSMASLPNPVNGAQNVSRSVVLSWTSATGAIAHDVYLGTNFTEVNNASDPDIFPGRGRQIATSFNPGGLEREFTYYWRIDEFDGNGVSKGNVWSFTVAAGRASNPNPINGASQVNPNVVLIWAAGDGAVSHDVYIGTNSSDVESAAIPIAVVTSSRYDPCGIELGKTYYWRVDEYDGLATYKGDIWQFTTVSAIQTPAFPGAEGAGKWSVGGRGGTVYEVTNLNDSGPGSLREAVNASGRRIVVFRVSGTISLLSNLAINNPYITIAGQTAPGDGICLKDHSLTVSADHVIIRYLRVRPADNAATEPDAISVGKGQNIILDHCSASWGVDETLSTSVPSNAGAGYLDKVTVQWCLIVESLDCSTHSEGCHGYGTLAKGCYGAQYTYHHNLYAHHRSRNPYPGNYQDVSVDPQGLTFDFRNNVVYNWMGPYAGYNTQSGANSVTRMNFIGNYYKQGFNSTDNDAFFERVLASRGYFSCNWMNTGYPADPWSIVRFDSSWTSGQISAFKLSSPTPVSDEVMTDDAVTAYERVLADAGASLPVRDVVDERIINDVRNGTGHIINDEDEVGSWPVLVSSAAPLDSDHDGMPDEWEIARGLNPNKASDNAADRDLDGYTNVEEYLNYLVATRCSSVDLDDDGSVSWSDMAILSSNWLKDDCGNVPKGNLDLDCDVDFTDFSILAGGWSN